jgi:hypothetical protein
LSLPEADVWHYVNAMMSRCGFVDPAAKFSKGSAAPNPTAPVGDRTSGEDLNPWYNTFEATCAPWLPECRNLGARFHTEYHLKSGLTKDQQTQILETLIGQKGLEMSRE